MNQLITAVIKSKNIAPVLEFPKKLLLENEIKVIEWIVAYEATYGDVPTLEQIERNFDTFIPLPSKGVPMQAIYDSVLNERILSFVNMKMAEATEILETDRRVPLNILQEIQEITALSQQVYKFSTFNRMGYLSKKGLKTGLTLIDAATGGIRGGDYALIVGRLGTGKTTLALWFCYGWWKAGLKVLLVSNEMLPNDAFAKLDAMVGHFNPLILRTIEEDELQRLSKTMAGKARGSTGEIIIPSMRMLKPSQTAAIARAFDVDVVIIDGVYLMMPDYDTKAQRWERITGISNSIKQHTLALGKPCLGITQLKRVGDKKDLDPEDLAYADALGQDADFIIALRPNKLIPTKLEAQLIKNRYGSTLATEISINFDKMEITETSMEARKLEDSETGLLW